MQAAQDKARREYEAARREFITKRTAALKARQKLNREVMSARTWAPWDIGLGRAYCGLIGLFAPGTAHAQAGAPPPPQAVAPSVGIPENAPSATLDIYRIRLNDSRRQMTAYGVEIHKKFALAVACFVFVLLGAPIALRFPRGGVGLTIGVSLLVFALYYVCLTAGESLGKRGVIPPVIAMWAANILFALVAVWLLSKIGREARTARGGDMGEMIDSIRGWTREKLGRDRRRRAALRTAA